MDPHHLRDHAYLLPGPQPALRLHPRRPAGRPADGGPPTPRGRPPGRRRGAGRDPRYREARSARSAVAGLIPAFAASDLSLSPCHSRERGNPGQPLRRLPWTPAFAGVTGKGGLWGLQIGKRGLSALRKNVSRETLSERLTDGPFGENGFT